MRALLAIVAALHVLNVLVVGSVADGGVNGRTFVPFFLTIVAGLAAAVLAFVLPWRRALLGLGGALLLAVTLGPGSQPVGIFDALSWASFTVPLAAISRRPVPAAVMLAFGSAAAFLAAILPALLIDRYTMLLPSYSPPGALMVALTLSLETIFAFALAWTAWRSPTPLAKDARRGVVRPASLVVLLAGVTLLALAWITGGTLMFVPVWPLAMVAIAGAVLLEAKRAPTLAILALVVAVIGFAPVGTCTSTWHDDTGRSGTLEERATLMEAGGNGPRWSSSDGFGGSRVSCPTTTVALGVAWAAGLVVLAAATVRRGMQEHAPRAEA